MAAGDIAAADTSVDRTVRTKNEIALLKRAFADMADGVARQADILTLIASGDYSASIPIRSDADVMNKAVSDMLNKTNDMIFDIKQAASQVSIGSSQIAGGAQSLATGSTEQAASLQEFSATVSEIQAQSEGSAELAERVKGATSEAGRYMAESMRNMNELTEAMAAIDQSSQEIIKVIKTIDNIAFQTNILALNAAVEAARAGSAGKGFAVVADEVRNLASKSAEASGETAALIQNSVENVKRGSGITSVTAESLTSANKIVRENTEGLDTLSAMSRQTAMAIMEINTGIEQISGVVQTNSATAEESAAAAQEMSAQSNMLNAIVNRFKLRGGQSDRAAKREDIVYLPDASDKADDTAFPRS
jgi:methyl-accepting chemotaxis protein